MHRMQKAITLTAALEDYLEAIFNLCRFDKAARSRDIAESLNVHKSTVTAALKSLSQMQLINYSPYEAVTLTPEGRKLAADVVKRHGALRDFFIDVLRVDPELAESAACGMEHSIPREIVERLADFGASIAKCPRFGTEHPANGKDCVLYRSKSGAKTEAVPAAATTTLEATEPGRTVRVVSVKCEGHLKKRFSEMGLIRGALVKVERIAPMGDPVEIRIRGYHLSLRKEEAAKVFVEEGEGNTHDSC